MKTINFDTGIEVYKVNDNAVLKVNFKDPNLYGRFLEMQAELENIEKKYEEKTKGIETEVNEKGFSNAEQTLKIMREIDVEIKEKFAYVFGIDNNFDEIFNGVHLMAIDKNGNRIVSNFLEAINPIIIKALSTEENSVKTLVGNREQRRAKNNVGVTKKRNN